MTRRHSFLAGFDILSITRLKKAFHCCHGTVKMRSTTRSEYGLLALIFLARHGREEFIAAEMISKAQEIPLAFLEQILRILRQAGFVASSKGRNGGYRLACSADKIAIAAVIRLLDGALAPTRSASEYFYEPTPIVKEAKMLKVFKEIRDYVSKRLEETSLAEVA